MPAPVSQSAADAVFVPGTHSVTRSSSRRFAPIILQHICPERCLFFFPARVCLGARLSRLSVEPINSHQQKITVTVEAPQSLDLARPEIFMKERVSCLGLVCPPGGTPAGQTLMELTCVSAESSSGGARHRRCFYRERPLVFKGLTCNISLISINNAARSPRVSSGRPLCCFLKASQWIWWEPHAFMHAGG